MVCIAMGSVVAFLKRTCERYQSVSKVWIFGSRASNQARETSDYDLAFEWVQTEGENWGEFAGLLRESNPTLQSMDLVRMDLAGEDLRKKINSEGRLIYERHQAKVKKL